MALIRNHYVGRTFIQPSQGDRDAKVKVKYNPVREVLAGKSVVMVDDSIVRGTTTRGLVALIRAAGAREVHMRVSSPPITGPCYYGIDTPRKEELIAANILDRGNRRSRSASIRSATCRSKACWPPFRMARAGSATHASPGEYPTAPPSNADKLQLVAASRDL